VFGILLQIVGLVVVLQGLLYGLWLGGERAMMLELGLTALGALLFVAGRSMARKDSSS